MRQSVKAEWISEKTTPTGKRIYYERLCPPKVFLKKGVIMTTAPENAGKVLNSVKVKLNLDKFPRGTFVEGFGDDIAYIRYNGCIEDRFSSGELTDEEAEERAQKIIDTCGAPELNTSADFLATEYLPHCMRG